MDSLEYLEISNGKSFDKAIVFIHGWKGNKNSFESLSSILSIDNANWFFPQGPYKLDSKGKKYSWSYQHDNGSWEYKEPIFLLKNFLNDNILSKVDSKSVFFIGFSQGATVCYDFILQLDYPWGGVFPVAGFTRYFEKDFKINKNQIKTPIIIGHGKSDQVVPIVSSDKIYEYLHKNKFNVSYEKFNGGHKISINYLKKIHNIIDG